MDLEDNHEGIDNTEAQCYAGTDDADSNVNQASTSCTKDDAETSSSGKPKKSRVRRRKRELFKNIRDQIAYYFSDSNLRHDKFMRQLTGADAEQGQTGPKDDAQNDSDHLIGTTPVPIDSFLKFNKITQLIKQESDLFGAFEYDHQWTAFNIEIIYDPENRTVCRREPFFNSNSESNAKTIYVERFDVTIDNTFDFLKREFERFGSILSIRTPRFSHSKQLMGFAFIEYAKQSDAERAVQFFAEMTDNVHSNGTETTDVSTTASTRKRPLVESEELTQSETTPDSENVAVKKVKVSSDQMTVNCDTENKQSPGHPTVEGDQANADANSCEELTTKPPLPLSEEDSAALLSRMPQVRVMSKQRWTQYKNRYLKLQKSGQSCAFNLPSYDRYLCQTVQESFDLSSAPPLAECIHPPPVTVNYGSSQSRRSLKRANHEASAEKIRANESVNGGTIVQIDLFTSNAQAIASNRIRKCIRSIFEGQQGPEKTPNVPSLTEIAFIDVSDKMVNFQADGTIEAKCYIRTHQMNAAEMLLGEEFQQQLATSLGWDVSVQRLLILEESEVNAYWALINQSKKRKNRHQ